MEATGIEPVSENLSSAGGYKLVPGISFSLPVFSPRQDDQLPAPFVYFIRYARDNRNGLAY